MPDTATYTREEQLQRIAAIRQQASEASRREAREFDVVVEEIQQLRKEVEDVVAKLHDKSQQLRKLARRSTDEGASHVVLFASAHTRLAGALNQGVKRASSMDRLIGRAAQEREDAKRRAADQQKRREERERMKLAAQYQEAPTNAFDDLFGDLLDDRVSDAIR